MSTASASSWLATCILRPLVGHIARCSLQQFETVPSASRLTAINFSEPPHKQQHPVAGPREAIRAPIASPVKAARGLLVHAAHNIRKWVGGHHASDRTTNCPWNAICCLSFPA
ncbi:hypothetical protein IQ07DRAFT_597057 [Pyrenochaeta sp. DS3sAY3a]|nr:hypothetical protein IQ07DRAFT_597057 [Pyrenochaeta sp. DS3sAY3a]